MALVVWIALTAAACGPATPSPAVANQSGARTCPAASAVYPATGLVDEAPYWWVDGVSSAATEAWVFRHGAGEPCAARVTDVDERGTRVDGCPTPDPDNPRGAWVVFGGAEPTGCALASPEAVSARWIDPEAGGFADDGHPVPPEIASVVPAHTCASPGCETLWSVTRASAGGVDAYDVTFTWARPTGGDACEWESEDHHAVYVPRDGAPRQVPLSTEIEEMTFQNGLDGVLHDAGGARLLLSRANWTYGVHEIAADGTIAGGRIEPHGWDDFHEEDMDWWSMAAYCGP
jgi:hypothetical protein